MPNPTFAELKTFCEHDHWTPKKKTDHWRFTKTLPDGRTLRTTISFGSGEIGDAGLFATILRVQLAVTEAEFWRVAKGQGPAEHVAPATIVAATPSSLELKPAVVLQLRKRGVTDAQLRSLRTQAEVDRLLAP